MPTRILLDENIPIGVRTILSGYDVQTVPEMGWAGLGNGALLSAAEDSRFEVMVTADQNILAQQNLAGRKIAVVVLSTNHWVTIKSDPALIVAACAAADEGSCTVVQFTRRPRPAGWPQWRP